MICETLGRDIVTYIMCKKWYQRFKSGNFNLEDEELTGAPKKFKDEELEQVLAENPTQAQEELATLIGITRQSISLRLKKLGKIQKLGRWIPHELSEGNKKDRIRG
ncbi:Mariner Mos1 transposase [Anthophora plagiata]